MEWVHALTCMELNNYFVGVAAAAIAGNIFWFLKYCAWKGRCLEMEAVYGVDN